MHSTPVRRLLATCIAASLFTLAGSGCAYFKSRGQDAMDMMDVGVTFSSKPLFSLYASGPIVQVGSLGFGKVDGHFFGIGEGRGNLWGPHYESSVGLLVWGEEMLSYRFTEEELAALPPQEAALTANFMRVGPVGFVEGPTPSLKYIVSCPHYIHLGWIGLVATPRWLQMADFLVGWTTLDLCQDDGPKRDVPGGHQIWRGKNPDEQPSLIFTPKSAADAAKGGADSVKK